MSQTPSQPNPTGGPEYRPQGNQPSQGYPPQGYPAPGYPPQGGQPQRYPPQGGQPQGGQPQGYQPQGYQPQQGGYPPQSGPYAPQPGPYAPQPGYGPSGYQPPTAYGVAGRYGQQPPGSYQSGGRPPTKKSPGLIIGIVVAAVVLLVAVGGIFIALGGGSDEPVSTITPAPPTTQPTQPPKPTTEPSGQSGAPSPTMSPTQPSGDALDLGSGITLVPAAGWQVQEQGSGVASLTNGQGVFYGRQQQLVKGTNAVQSCDAYNRAALKSASNAEFGEAEPRDVGSNKLSAAVCTAAFTQTSGDQSAQVFLSTLVSVRKSDGLTVIGTLLFVKNTDDQTKSDASAMMSSMLTSQLS